MDIKTIFNCLMEFCKRVFQKTKPEIREVLQEGVFRFRSFPTTAPTWLPTRKGGRLSSWGTPGQGLFESFLLWIGETPTHLSKIHLPVVLLEKVCDHLHGQPEFSVLNLTSQILRSLPVSLPLSASIWFLVVLSLFRSLDTLPIIIPGTGKKLREDVKGRKNWMDRRDFWFRRGNWHCCV